MTKQVECPRCEGKGTIAEYGHIRDGVCFKCSGSGKVNYKPEVKKVDGKREAFMAESKRKHEAAIEIYRDRLIANDAPRDWWYAHAEEYAKIDGVWNTL